MRLSFVVLSTFLSSSPGITTMANDNIIIIPPPTTTASSKKKKEDNKENKEERQQLYSTTDLDGELSHLRIAGSSNSNNDDHWESYNTSPNTHSSKDKITTSDNDSDTYTYKYKNSKKFNEEDHRQYEPSNKLRNDILVDVDVDVDFDTVDVDVEEEEEEEEEGNECGPSIALSPKSKKLDAGNLPLSSCSSSTSSKNKNNKNKMICIDHYSMNNMRSSSYSSSITTTTTTTTTTTATNTDSTVVNYNSNEKKTNGICVDILDIPITYWDDYIRVHDHDHHLHDRPHDDDYYNSYPIDDDISYHHQQQQQQQQQKQLDKRSRRVQEINDNQALRTTDCTRNCITRPDVSSYKIYEEGSFQKLIYECVINKCPVKGSINCWNTANVTDMSYAFSTENNIYCAGLSCKEIIKFNEPLECWNVGKVTTMSGMFGGALFEDGNQTFNRFNQYIGSWDTSQVKNMDRMFFRAKKFNQPINEWDVGQVESMELMFRSARSFNQSVAGWDTSKSTNMVAMFRNAENFNQPLDDWNVSQVDSMQRMFGNAEAFNQCLSSWGYKTTNFINTTAMFLGTGCPDTVDPNPTIGPWCQNGNQGCVFVAPSSSPSTSPTTTASNPPTDIVVPLGICVDDTHFKFKNKTRFKGCESFVGKNARKKCKKEDPKNNNTLVSLSCPSFCLRFCPPCKDGKGLIRLADGTKFSCKDIALENKCGSQTQTEGSAVFNRTVFNRTDFNKAKFFCPVRCGIPGCSTVEIEEVSQ